MTEQEKREKLPVSEQNARFAIDGAIEYGRQGINKPPTADHWLMPYWELGRNTSAPASQHPETVAQAEQDKDAERYRFIRSMKDMGADLVDEVAEAMASIYPPSQEGKPTDAEFDASVDTGMAYIGSKQ